MNAEDFGFCGPAYGAPMQLQDSEQCINWYPEIAEVKGSKMPVALLGTPGLQQIGTQAPLSGTSYVGTMVAGTPGGFLSAINGYSVGSYGTLAPTTDSANNTILFLASNNAAHGQPATLTLTISGVQLRNYFSTLTLVGPSVNITLNSAAATFTSSGGNSNWVWPALVSFAAGSTYSVSYVSAAASAGIGGQVRALWCLPGGTQALAVIGNTCYLMNGTPGTANSAAQFNLTAVGTLNTASGPVCIRDNGAPFGGAGGMAIIVDGPYGYFYNIGSNGTTPTSVVFNGAITVGSPVITLPGVFPSGLLMSTTATLSDAGGFISGTIISANYSNPQITASQAATANLSNDTITLTIPVFGQISDPGFLGAYRVAFIEGWLVFAQPASRTMYSTGPVPYSLLFPGLWFALKDSSTDNIVTLHENDRELWAIGERTSEVWYNAGNANGFPFSRIPGVGPQIGCAATNSIARVGNNLIWLAQNEQGQNYVVMQSGYEWERISTHGVDHAIAQYAVVNDAIAYSYEEDGHLFMVLIFPTADATWVFDLTASKNLGEKCWHQRASLDSNGVFHRHRSNAYMNFLNTRIVGDYQNGLLYQMSRAYYSDNGATLRSQRTARHIWSATDRKRVFHSQLQLEFTPGVGLQSGQGSDPQVMLQWSNDGGFTWSGEFWRSIGRAGQTTKRAIWRRLGVARDRVYRVAITDPVARDVIGATLFAEAEEAA